MLRQPWDYLILTASNEQQAAAYRTQLAFRSRLGLLGGVGDFLVVADPGGRRIGSGGSTILCLLEVLRDQAARFQADVRNPADWRRVLKGLRILVLHAGGDARRLPAYGPCGKIFLPLPLKSDSALGATLFDRQLPVYLGLPSLDPESGQLVIAAGDVLLTFSPGEVAFAPTGVTGLGYLSSADQATHHGVYCAGTSNRIRRFLQKPGLAAQAEARAINADGQTVLDIGVLNFDASASLRMLEMCQVRNEGGADLRWSGPVGRAIDQHGLDIYREFCCAMGEETTLETYRTAVQQSGSRWEDDALDCAFHAVSTIPCRLTVLSRCDFLHFGTTEEILASGQELLHRDVGFSAANGWLNINNDFSSGARVLGSNAWVEGCQIAEPLTVSGSNVVVGLEVDQPLSLSPQSCVDVLPGYSRAGEPVKFVRCYHRGDRFQNSSADLATFCGRPLNKWLANAKADPDDVWDRRIPLERRSVWNARLFPTEQRNKAVLRWLWMLEPSSALPDQWQSWRMSDRYSLEEMALLADQQAFHARRAELRTSQVCRSLAHTFRQDSSFSAADLAHLLSESGNRDLLVAEMIAEIHRRWRELSAENAFVAARMLHSLGSALLEWATDRHVSLPVFLPGLAGSLPLADSRWLDEVGLSIDGDGTLAEWADRAQTLAFEHLSRRIVESGERPTAAARCALRTDEIVWGRAPARLDLAGGWTDTPPYTLEHGGCVLNAAVELNGQPPIQVYCRVVPERVIRLGSIDTGTSVTIRQLDELLNVGHAGSDFSLVKAALLIAGVATPPPGSNGNLTLAKILDRFGGGLELTTVAVVPKGSGLGTSSILGAVLLAVIHRVMGRKVTDQELFNAVLRLEQTLTTGGGWQDQIGGSVDGLKLVTTEPGLVPRATLRHVPADVLDPALNGGVTLLYYTGITRLAKNILRQVVGRYLDRDRSVVATLAEVRALAPEMAEAIAGRDLAGFGQRIATAWELNKRLDPNSTTPQLEALLQKAAPYVHGAKLLGAGGGGFLLLVARSTQHADDLRSLLERDPPNGRARFYDFAVASRGLTVSVC